MQTNRPPPEQLQTFAAWLRAGRYVPKGTAPTAYRVSDFEPLYPERHTRPLPAAPPTAAPAPILARKDTS